MGTKVQIDQLAEAVMAGLEDYAKLATEDLKKEVGKAARQVRKEIAENAPKKTGAYAKSWTATKESETAESVRYVVHSKDHYQLAHLLEHGHALRNGGRSRAFPHIAPAEEHGKEMLLQSIKRDLKKAR